MTKEGDIEVTGGRIAGNSSFRGAVTLPAGQGSMRIDTSWDTPSATVNVTPTWNTNVWVEDVSETGFTVHVSQPPAENSRLFWLAIW